MTALSFLFGTPSSAPAETPPKPSVRPSLVQGLASDVCPPSLLFSIPDPLLHAFLCLRVGRRKVFKLHLLLLPWYLRRWGVKGPVARSPLSFIAEAAEEGHKATCLAGGRVGTSSQAP